MRAIATIHIAGFEARFRAGSRHLIHASRNAIVVLVPKRSAGLLMYRFAEGELQVLLVHPGGPLWKKKDKGAWFVPKGEINPGEEDFPAAQREFIEETGLTPVSPFLPLGEITQKSGKKVVVWAFEGDCNPGSICSNTFEMEWPPRSGKKASFPEVDRAAFYNRAAARDKMIIAEYEFVTRLERTLNESTNEDSTHLTSEKLTGTKSK